MKNTAKKQRRQAAPILQPEPLLIRVNDSTATFYTGQPIKTIAIPTSIFSLSALMEDILPLWHKREDAANIKKIIFSLSEKWQKPVRETCYVITPKPVLGAPHEYITFRIVEPLPPIGQLPNGSP